MNEIPEMRPPGHQLFRRPARKLPHALAHKLDRELVIIGATKRYTRKCVQEPREQAPALGQLGCSLDHLRPNRGRAAAEDTEQSRQQIRQHEDGPRAAVGQQNSTAEPPSPRAAGKAPASRVPQTAAVDPGLSNPAETAPRTAPPRPRRRRTGGSRASDASGQTRTDRRRAHRTLGRTDGPARRRATPAPETRSARSPETRPVPPRWPPGWPRVGAPGES